jgi:hypothetical protein
MTYDRRMRSSWRDDSFFGVHYDLHAAADDTHLGAVLTHDYLRAEIERVAPDWLQCDAKGHPGFTSYPTSVGTPSPGIVHDALRIHRDVTRELGLPLVVHYSGVIDEQAVRLHPDWAVVDADGEHDTMKTCVRSGYRDELMIPQLLELVDDYDVDGIWVDGENWAAVPCWCERCREAFGRPVPTTTVDDLWPDWLAFHRDGFVAHVVAYCDAVHERKPTCQVTSNWMGGLIQPGDVPAAVDWLSGDAAPGVDIVVNARALDGQDRAWELMTWGFITPKPGHPVTDLKPLAHLQQELAIGLACGGGVQIYDLPERSGHLVAWRQEVLAAMALWCRARHEVVRGTTSVPQAAVLQSDRHHYLHSDPLFTTGDGDAPVIGAVHALLDSHIHVDVINEADLLRRGGDYPLLVVPEQEDLSSEAIAALERYVEAGGHLLVTGSRAAAVMPALVGARSAGDPVAGYSLLRSGQASIKVTGPWQPVTLVDARAEAHLLASWEPHDATEHVAVTVRHAGTGRVVAAHGPLFAHHAEHHVPRCRDLIGELCALTGAELALEVDAPHRLHATLREKDGATIVHLVNMTGRHPLAVVTTHIEEVGPTGPVTVRVRTVRTPASVHLVPGHVEPRWATSAGWTTVELPDVDVHLAVVLR